MDKKLEELSVNGVVTTYALFNMGDGNRCAWCHKLASDFKNINDHITQEDALAKIEEAYGNSEELLYGDFKKLKEEILNG